MAVSRTLATNFVSTATSSGHEVPLPPYVSGERWVLAVLAVSTTTPSVAGWVELTSQRAATTGTGAYLKVYYLDPVGAEGSTVTVSLSAAGQVIAFVYRLSGHSAAAPVAVGANSSTSSPTTLDVTTTGVTVESLALHFYGVNTGVSSGGDAAIGLDDGIVEDVEAFLDWASSSNDLSLAAGGKTVTANETFTGTSSIAGRTAAAVVTQPAATGPVTVAVSGVTRVGAAGLAAATGAHHTQGTAVVAARTGGVSSPGTDTWSTDFDGAALPAPWAFTDPAAVGASLSVSGSRAIVLVPGGVSVDSISSTSSPDNSVGLTAAVPDHGGAVDIAVQVDTDVSDMRGQGLNLICKGSGSDAARFAWYHPDDNQERPYSYGYGRASGSGSTLGGGIATIATYMSGIPAWLRITYDASTGTWSMLDSADGATWTTRRSGVRAFTPASFKVGFSTTASSPTGAAVRINQVVDVLGAGTTDLRGPLPPRAPVTVTTILGTDAALPSEWVDDSAGTSTVTFTGTAMRLAHDCTQDATGGAAAARIRYTGTPRSEWGIYLRVSNPGGNTDAYGTVGAAKAGTGTWIDQYVYDGGYGLEIQSGPIRRPIRIDDTTGATVAPSAPFATDLNEMPYCHLAQITGAYDMRLGGVRCFRLERHGRRYRAKEWADGAAEPTTWDLFDGQDQVEDDALTPTLTLSHNGVRAGTVTFDVYELQFYELTATSGVAASGAAPVGVAVSASSRKSVAVSGTCSAAPMGVVSARKTAAVSAAAPVAPVAAGVAGKSAPAAAAVSGGAATGGAATKSVAVSASAPVGVITSRSGVVARAVSGVCSAGGAGSSRARKAAVAGGVCSAAGVGAAAAVKAASVVATARAGVVTSRSGSLVRAVSGWCRVAPAALVSPRKVASGVGGLCVTTPVAAAGARKAVGVVGLGAAGVCTSFGGDGGQELSGWPPLVQGPFTDPVVLVAGPFSDPSYAVSQP